MNWSPGVIFVHDYAARVSVAPMGSAGGPNMNPGHGVSTRA